MIKRFILVAAMVLGVAAGSGMACEGSCKASLSFEGNHAQSSSAFVDRATVKKGNVVDGTQAGAVQGTSGSFKGTSGIGITGGIGITAASAESSYNKASAMALAGNVGISGVVGYKTCAKLKGSGEASTVAVKRNGAASSNGSFKYQGQLSQGVIIGGGLTGGFSNVQNGPGSVVSSAGHVTVSGITSIR